MQEYEQDLVKHRATIDNLDQELRYTRWVTNLHKYLVIVEEDLQAVADRLSRYLDPRDRATLYSTINPNEISLLPTLRWASRVYGRYYRKTFQATEDMEDSLKTWKLDRNYFAHHSSTDELARRGMVMENAQTMHGDLAKLIVDLDQDRDADLALLASDAFSDL